MATIPNSNRITVSADGDEPFEPPIVVSIEHYLAGTAIGDALFAKKEQIATRIRELHAEMAELRTQSREIVEAKRLLAEFSRAQLDQLDPGTPIEWLREFLKEQGGTPPTTWQFSVPQILNAGDTFHLNGEIYSVSVS